MLNLSVSTFCGWMFRVDVLLLLHQNKRLIIIKLKIIQIIRTEIIFMQTIFKFCLKNIPFVNHSAV